MAAKMILNKMLTTFLSEKNEGTMELEVKFKHVTSAQYDNVIAKLLKYGFKIEEAGGLDMLRMFFSGQSNDDEVRAEVNGLAAISAYCQTGVLPSTTQFMKKRAVKDADRRADFQTDFNFLVDLKTETILEAMPLIKKYETTPPSLLRSMKRFTFVREDTPLKVDMTIVRSAKTAAALFSVEHPPQDVYEVEAEFLHDKIIAGRMDQESVLTAYRSLIKYILTGLQDSNFPISNTEMQEVQQNYAKLVGIKEIQKETQEQFRNFIGPNSVALERINSIAKDYTVTDKADGVRKLLYIAASGKVYFITKEMLVQYTGVTLKEKDMALKETILDGEHITKAKDGVALNLYAAFDLYYIEGNAVFNKNFWPQDDKEEDSRYGALKYVCKYLKKKVLPEDGLQIIVKRFYADDAEGDIFQKSKKVLENTKRPYNTDGLIFTPALLAVSDAKDKMPTNYIWKNSFKWKKTEENSVDFLIQVENKDQGLVSLYIYKNQENVLFKPMVKYTNTDAAQATIENLLVDGQHVRSGDIVEFAYNTASQTWQPLRLRSDKRKPNGDGVAQQTWRTIHEPVTLEMLTHEPAFADATSNSDEYYNAENVHTHSQKLAAFHNKVKSLLITGTAASLPEPISLLDLSAGRGGDLLKWQHAKVQYVLGIDKSSTNLKEAVKRFTELDAKKKLAFTCDFVQGDTSRNLRTGQAALKAEDNAQIIKIITKEHPIGFNINSIQFSLHYMFENLPTLNGFLQNVMENTATGGYFIGTCYDGMRVFTALQDTPDGVLSGPAFRVEREYDAESEFPATDAGVGLRINVNQESISKTTFPEWLVNFDYVTQKMGEIGFKPLSEAELHAINWPIGTDYDTKKGYGSFQSLYARLDHTKFTLSPEEEKVSFLNNYFIYKKTEIVLKKTTKATKTATTTKAASTKATTKAAKTNAEAVFRDLPEPMLLEETGNKFKKVKLSQ